MSSDKRRATAKVVLFVYVLISATFNLAHRDYVPLASRRVFAAENAPGHNIHTDGGDFVCPAHNFAQSTTSADPSFHKFSSPKSFAFLKLADRPDYFARPHQATSSRAPPRA